MGKGRGEKGGEENPIANRKRTVGPLCTESNKDKSRRPQATDKRQHLTVKRQQTAYIRKQKVESDYCRVRIARHDPDMQS